MSRKKRQTLLASVLVVAFMILAWRQWGPGTTGSGPALGRSGANRGGGSHDGVGVFQPVTEFRIADLTRQRGKYEPGRDLFQYYVPRPPKPKPAPPKGKTRREKEADRALAQAAKQERRESAKLQPPPVSVEYLGSFGPRDRQIAVFSGEDEIYNAFEGDVLEEKFIVDKIGLESVDLKFVGFPDAPAERLAAGS